MASKDYRRQDMAKKFTAKYALSSGRESEKKELHFGDSVRQTKVYQTAKEHTPEGKELREIEYEGTVLFRRGSWYRQSKAFKKAFPKPYG